VGDGHGFLSTLPHPKQRAHLVLYVEWGLGASCQRVTNRVIEAYYVPYFLWASAILKGDRPPRVWNINQSCEANDVRIASA